MKFGIMLTAWQAIRGRTRTSHGRRRRPDGDGVFTYDGISVGPMDTYDPWVVIAAMAMRTERVTLGATDGRPRRVARKLA